MDKIPIPSDETETVYWEYWKNTLEPFYKSGEKIILKSKLDGLRLQGVFYKCTSSDPHGTILIVPGRTEGSLKYTETCYDFAKLGFNVLVFGHRGQGFSSRLLKNSQIGHVHHFEDYSTDLDQWYEEVCLRGHTNSPHIVAHSMGALVACQWLESSARSVSSVTLTSPMTRLNFGKVPEFVLHAVVSLRCLFGGREDFSVTPGELNLDSYGSDLTSSTKRLFWYRKVLAENPELLLGYPSNWWLKLAIENQKKWNAKRCQSLVQKVSPAPFLVLEAEKDQVVCSSPFSTFSTGSTSSTSTTLSTGSPPSTSSTFSTSSNANANNSNNALHNFKFQKIPDAQHDLFIERDSIRNEVLESFARHCAGKTLAPRKGAECAS